MLVIVAVYWLCVWDYITSDTTSQSTSLSLVLAIGGIVLLLAVIIKGEDGS